VLFFLFSSSIIFFASFVSPCHMIYFGMNCNHLLWNPSCCSFAFSLRWGTTLESLVLFFLFSSSIIFFASFVSPCHMIYFGMNCNHLLWNPSCCSFAFSPLCALSIA